MSRLIQTEPLTAEAFAPFGDVLEANGAFHLINEGWCQRHHDRARLDFGPLSPPQDRDAAPGTEAGAGTGIDGRAGLSIFQARPRSLPYSFQLIERHPLGSQAFIPMSLDPFLVIVAESPEARPRAFLTRPGQAINLWRGTWHGVLTPLSAPGLFAVVDRIGTTANLEEFRYDAPWTVA